MHLPTWDVFIGLAFIIGIAYGFILRREKTITALCATFIGLVIATNFSGYLFQVFNGNQFIANSIWIRSNASLSTISIATLLIVSVLITASINSSSQRNGGDISPFEVVIYSALNIALIISSIIGFLPELTRSGILTSSMAAKILFNYRTAWIVLPPLALIILNITHRDR